MHNIRILSMFTKLRKNPLSLFSACPHQVVKVYFLIQTSFIHVLEDILYGSCLRGISISSSIRQSEKPLAHMSTGTTGVATSHFPHPHILTVQVTLMLRYDLLKLDQVVSISRGGRRI